MKKTLLLGMFTSNNSKYDIKTWGVNLHSDLKVMKSSWLANVITRLLSSFGTGKRYLRIFDTCVSRIN